MGATDGVRRRCRVATEPHRDRALTLYGTDGRTYQVIDAADGVRERLGDLRCGDTVGVALEPVRCRGDGWRIVRMDEATSSGSPRRRPAAEAKGRSAAGPTSR
ncbi:hypothetical protein U4E84_14155 [Halorubrum sp. AD140]|uniref:hypothetical protein n=1 Tax=Halorubrum sp. AD140 TaxID=3050073 RepID=UPI002ACCCD88|nr:hypothetical protein [Halorubrum sp. AD140]MDZ5812489.1 hypothetical protein [Halorubrum sp. AD140]